MKEFNCKNIKFLFLFLTSFFLQGCPHPGGAKLDTKLYGGKGRYTGEFYVYRVDDAWAPQGSERKRYYVGDSFTDKTKEHHIRQWVPVREKDDIAGLDGPDRIVTTDDLVTVSLRNVFIKYFKESSLLTKAKGEIAFILSFGCGEKIKEDLLIYASEGQTLGTSLALDDLTIIGPEKLDCQSLRIRLIMVEVDQIENEIMKRFIGEAAGLASTVQPQYGTAIKIASDLAQFIISSNKDDIIFDRTFELSMTQKGGSVEKTPLLYGQYVLLLQEDRSQGDVEKKAGIATRPPRVGDMRFNLHAGRLFNTYMYRPIKIYEESEFLSPDYVLEGETDEDDVVFDLGNKRVDFSQGFTNITDDGDYYLNNEKHIRILNEKINAKEALTFRNKTLAFPLESIGDLDLWGNMGETLKTIYLESVRYPSEKEIKDETLPFHFPVYLYPRGYTILAQYPFHTHLVLSVSRSIGISEKATEDRYETYANWLESAKGEIRSNERFENYFNTIKQDIQSQTLVDMVLKKAMGKKEKEEKICTIAGNISNERIIVKTPLYNELFHLTGDIFQSEQEVKDYIAKEHPNCAGN